MRTQSLTSDHVDAAVELWDEAGLTRPWNDPRADFLRAVQGPGSAVIGALDAAGTIVATAMVGLDGHRGWVYYLAVAASHRGQGLAGTLMRVCEDWVRDRGIPKIQLMVRSDNLDAVALYEHLGYAVSDVVVLGRRLDGA